MHIAHNGCSQFVQKAEKTETASKNGKQKEAKILTKPFKIKGETGI